MRPLTLFCLLLLTGCASWKVVSKDSFQTIYSSGNSLKVCHGEKGEDDCDYVYKLPNGNMRICEYKKPCEDMTAEHFLSHFF